MIVHTTITIIIKSFFFFLIICGQQEFQVKWDKSDPNLGQIQIMFSHAEYSFSGVFLLLPNRFPSIHSGHSDTYTIVGHHNFHCYLM